MSVAAANFSRFDALLVGFKIPESMQGVALESQRAPGEMAIEPEELATNPSNDNSVQAIAARVEETTRAWAQQAFETANTLAQGEEVTAALEATQPPEPKLTFDYKGGGVNELAAQCGQALNNCINGMLGALDKSQQGVECDPGASVVSNVQSGQMREQGEGRFA